MGIKKKLYAAFELMNICEYLSSLRIYVYEKLKEKTQLKVCILYCYQEKHSSHGKEIGFKHYAKKTIHFEFFEFSCYMRKILF